MSVNKLYSCGARGSGAFCPILLIVTVLCSGIVSCNSHHYKQPTTNTRLVHNSRNVVGQGSHPKLEDSDLSQRQMKNDEYEQLTQQEEVALDETRATATGQQRVVPSLENNGNSQVVYVNLARVVSDRNDTQRVISSHQQLIKQEGQISCGETNRNGNPSSNPTNDPLQNRIVGGNKADPGEFPYQVRLNIRSRRGSSLCGGVIIDKRHILTAAHCMTTW